MIDQPTFDYPEMAEIICSRVGLEMPHGSPTSDVADYVDKILRHHGYTPRKPDVTAVRIIPAVYSEAEPVEGIERLLRRHYQRESASPWSSANVSPPPTSRTEAPRPVAAPVRRTAAVPSAGQGREP